ncbi:hypothetical protein RSOLAG1IB_08742 [Rhizoctonia solani AG-1 IB]|uniref:Laminin domain protein n=1 Tax=Thanatephorus cucumeris (strain AG1-IB / isolate 7/3/14) TaxID=1108050 RepID=A0A0B7FR38_THACB|nr:hypothetical protein RSOLAG1IB_08742 [Rhizoctonia solani AG-1 IB]
MPPFLAGQVCTPPDLPPYLKKVYELKPIAGAPNNEELMGIHAVIRVASRVVDVPDMGDHLLLVRLSEHLFNAQMAKYQSKYSRTVFPENTTYAPPVLPAHVSVKLEAIIGAPSEEEIIKVQSTIRSYHQFSSIPSMFNPRVDMELSQHLFDIQMAKYALRVRENFVPSEASVEDVEDTTLVLEETNNTTNNAGSGANIIESARPTGMAEEIRLQDRDVIERSNRIAEQANQLAERSNRLIERSNQIAEVLNQLLERYSHYVEQPQRPPEKSDELLERLNGHFEKSNQLAAESKKPTERLGEILGTMNKVLVGIQHAIVRNHAGNTQFAVDCLINEQGDTLSKSTSGSWSFRSLFDLCGASDPHIPMFIDGTLQSFCVPERILGAVLSHHGIGEDLCESGRDTKLKPGSANIARARLNRYWSSCLG